MEFLKCPIGGKPREDGTWLQVFISAGNSHGAIIIYKAICMMTLTGRCKLLLHSRHDQHVVKQESEGFGWVL